KRQMVHRLDDLAALLKRLAEEVLDVMTGEIFLERKTGENRTRRQHAERNEDHRRTFVRRLVVLLVMRRTVESLEDQPPGIERRHARRRDRHQESVERK